MDIGGTGQCRKNRICKTEKRHKGDAQEGQELRDCADNKKKRKQRNEGGG